MSEQQVFLQVRVDKSLKAEAEDILDKLGIEMPTAIRMFLKKVVLEGGIPFDTKLPDIKFDKDDNVIRIPAKPAKYVPETVFCELVKQIPAGRLIRHSDIEKYLMKIYQAERIEFTGYIFEYPNWLDLPYWRIVSERGFLQDTSLCSRERQEKKLIEEGLTVVHCGKDNRSLKVENYKELLFNLDVLRK